jgi:hypothetical protein
VRWIVTLSGGRQDVERLAVELSDLLTVDNAESGRPDLRMELADPEGDATGEDAPHAAKAVIDAHIRRINGFGRLRWGRTFDGVSIAGLRTVATDGKVMQTVFVDPGHGDLSFEQFADMVERLGHPRPPAPAGLDVIRALDGEAVTELAAANPDVAHVLRLVDLMLVGNDEIDWGAGYSALEVIDQDLTGRGLDGRDLGWWTRAERRRFNATANSVEVLGTRARHGKRSGPTEARMTSKDASWLVRRAAAHWVTRLIGKSDDVDG